MSERMAIVLAAGKGTRMKSDLPKVLSRACGRPLIDYVIDALEAASIDRVVVVVGYQAEKVQEALSGRRNIAFALQAEQKGTGHAVQMCRDELSRHDGPVLIVAGDSPMLQAASIQKLLDRFEKERPACLLGTLHKDDPQGLGRIVRDAAGQFVGIVEEKDASDEQRAITEVNMSTYLFNSRDLRHALDKLQNNNRQGEYYLTDCPGILLADGKKVEALPVLSPREALSVNTVEELRVVEEALAARSAC